MGLEVVCTVRFGEQVSEGKALLETAELIFRGDFRLRIPFRDISSLNAEDGGLAVGFSNGLATFELGDKTAATWMGKIRNPRGLMEKLGVKQGQVTLVLGVEDAEFLEAIDSIADVTEGTLKPDADLIFYEADLPEDLIWLPDLAAAIKPNGAVWVVSPKGKGAAIKDTDVMAAAKAAGLVDTKVVSFSKTHTSLKLVIPVANRTR
jgi:hypothetical protein